jgi:hypothetical protein
VFQYDADWKSPHFEFLEIRKFLSLRLFRQMSPFSIHGRDQRAVPTLINPATAVQKIRCKRLKHNELQKRFLILSQRPGNRVF